MNIEIANAILRNAEQALAGPLGAIEREQVVASAEQARQYISEYNRDIYEADNPNHTY